MANMNQQMSLRTPRLMNWIRPVSLLALCLGSFLMAGPALAADWASVIMYHRFGEAEYPATNITMEQFRQHVQELQEGGYSVLPLGQIVDQLETGKSLPDKTVALTVDDAFLSVYESAWPLLKEAGFPVTVFVSTDALDSGLPDFMSWDQLKELVEAGVHVGHHSASHGHFPTYDSARIREDIEKANSRFQEMLGFVPGIFAYPYGEYGSEIKALIAEMGFKAAFGQHSGVAYAGYDKYAYPRFAMNESYGGIGRLRLAAKALPLRVREVMPTDNILQRNPPAFGFTIDEEYSNLNQLSCYASNQSGGTVPIERLGERRVEIRLSRAFPAGRGRINCTLPGPEGRYHWFGSLFYIPRNP
jgi:peptidoglycan/xylan/chitin deacetylase (PgdA/CDA1 family)